MDSEPPLPNHLKVARAPISRTVRQGCPALPCRRAIAESDTAERGMHNTLLNVVRAGLIRQLPNGNFAPATVLDTIRLRRAM